MSHQLKLFELEAERNTPDALSLLRNGATLVLSVSGGKDSDAMRHHLLEMNEREGWTGETVMVYADSSNRME